MEAGVEGPVSHGERRIRFHRSFNRMRPVTCSRPCQPRAPRLPALIASQSGPDYWAQALPDQVSSDSIVNRLANNARRINLDDVDVRRQRGKQSTRPQGLLGIEPRDRVTHTPGPLPTSQSPLPPTIRTSLPTGAIRRSDHHSASGVATITHGAPKGLDQRVIFETGQVRGSSAGARLKLIQPDTSQSSLLLSK